MEEKTFDHLPEFEIPTAQPIARFSKYVSVDVPTKLSERERERDRQREEDREAFHKFYLFHPCKC
jgi:hypothetical protein